MSSVIWLTGPPGAGKTTVANEIAKLRPKVVHIPVDRIRQWVVAGLSESVNWTDETTRQFELAELSACDATRRYQDAGFDVIIDHCRNLARIEEVIKLGLPNVLVTKICLLPSLEVNRERNASRENKSFPTEVLLPIIEGMNPGMTQALTAGWHVIDSSLQTPSETAAQVLGLIKNN